MGEKARCRRDLDLSKQCAPKIHRGEKNSCGWEERLAAFTQQLTESGRLIHWTRRRVLNVPSISSAGGLVASSRRREVSWHRLLAAGMLISARMTPKIRQKYIQKEAEAAQQAAKSAQGNALRAYALP